MARAMALATSGLGMFMLDHTPTPTNKVSYGRVSSMYDAGHERIHYEFGFAEAVRYDVESDAYGKPLDFADYVFCLRPSYSLVADQYLCHDIVLVAGKVAVCSLVSIVYEES